MEKFNATNHKEQKTTLPPLVEQAITFENSGRYVVDFDRLRQLSFPEANLEAVEAAVEKYGDTWEGVVNVAKILEQHSLNQAAFYRIGAFHPRRDSDKGIEGAEAVFKYAIDTHNLIGEIDKDNYDTVFYLDKSARPVAAFVNGLWDKVVPEGNTAPNTEFINVDRVKILQSFDYKLIGSDTAAGPATNVVIEAKQKFDMDRKNDAKVKKRWKEYAARLRQLFIEEEVDEANILEAFSHQSTLDGTRICVVDEVKFSGVTSTLAKELIKEAFPTATVDEKYFWKKQDTTVPIWYERDYITGRGIGDISEAYYKDLDQEITPLLEESAEKEAALKTVRRMGRAALLLSSPLFEWGPSGERMHYSDEAYQLLMKDLEVVSQLDLLVDYRPYVGVRGAHSQKQAKIEAQNEERFLKKLKAIGYNGPGFSQESLKGLGFGDKKHPGAGYLNLRRRNFNNKGSR